MAYQPLFRWLLVSSLVLSGASCTTAREPDRQPAKGLPQPFSRLLPLHHRLAPARPGEWLTAHPERGQTYPEYLAGRPVRVDRQRRVLYIQPLGDFDEVQRKIIDRTAELMGIYFQLPVKVQKDLPLSTIPSKARRRHPTWGGSQILSTYVLDEVLRPRLPKDACASIALTASDLWPGEGWNFVFGQASLSDRVGVWSIHRYGDPHASDDTYRLCLSRTLKTATHETGHMFSMRHCTAFECNMCGSNHLDEADGKPLWLCPVCLAKLCHATGADPVKRYEGLARFCKEQGLEKERAFYEKSLAVLRGGSAP